jgi:hypothetical protein
MQIYICFLPSCATLWINITRSFSPFAKTNLIEWNSDENAASIDEINGEDAFEQFGMFNPNNPCCWQ